MRGTKHAAKGAGQQSSAEGGRTRRGTRGRLLGIVMAAVALIGLAAAPAASAATSSAAAARPAKTATAKPSATTRPSAKAQPAKERPAKEQPAVLSLSEQRRLAAAAVRKVLADSTVPNTCSGPISPDTIYPCNTPSSSGTDTFTITLADTTDVVYVLPLSVSGELGLTLTAPDGSTVSCQANSGEYVCPTSQAGTYTLAVGNGGNSYTLDYTALLSDTGCTAINPSFAAPAIAGSLAAGQTGSCYTLDVPSGSVLYLMGFSPSFYPAGLDVYDSTGANQNCDLIGANTCTVGGTAPYRIFIYGDGTPGTYQLELYNLTNPQGCVATPQLAYGQVPNTSSADPCRTLTVTKAGNYQVVPVPAPNGPQVLGTVYAANGSVACQYYQYPFCPLAVGSYEFVVDPGQTAAPFGFDFIAGDQSKGCTATGDTGFKGGPATGKFAGIGEEICLTLPTPNGKADYFFEQQNPDGTTEPNVEVIDATGAVQCGSNVDFSYDSCSLSGTAPFRVLLSAVSAPDSYRILINRTDSTAGCATWPQSGFGGSWGATVTITQPADVKCLVIPAGQHSTGEMIDYSNAANVVDGEIDVRDPAGNEICLGLSTAICSYQPGTTYTALVSTTNPKGDTYHLVRRDVSQTARCAAPASTTIGGPSTTFTLTSDLDTVCYRVTAATADKLWFDVRTVGNTPPPPPASEPAAASAVLQVTNASGAFVCRQWGTVGCRVTGSADYQLIVTAEGYAGIAITTHVDAWRVATASGWAAQCTSHSVNAAGNWGPLSLTLTEQATGSCTLVNGLAVGQTFGIFGTDSAPGEEMPLVNIYTNWDWTQNLNGLCGQNNLGQFGFSCGTSQEQNPSQGILMVAPGSAQSPTAVAMWGVCASQCSAPTQTSTLTSVSPASQPAGSNTIVITGTNLTMATQFQLLNSNSGTVATGTPVSVNAAGTQLTLLLYTGGVPTGTYNAWLGQVSCSPPVPCPGYLPNAYTVTAAPTPPSPERYTALNPARILDTRSGLGAPKAKVGAHGTVTLTVAGTGGVPAENATAVALDVTAISPSAAGHLIVYPAGTTRPGVIDLSFSAGQTVTNLVVVKLNDGKVSFYNGDGGQLDLAADVVGYYTTSTGATFTATSPARILDTRSGLGAPKAKVGAHGTVTLTVAGAGGVPGQGATAVAVNVQALSPTATGSLTIYPNGTSRPATSALSFTAGRSTATLAVVRLVNGKVSIYNGSSGELDLTADVVGYYSSSGATFLPVIPTRILDTRSGLGGSGQTVLSHAVAVTQVTNLPEIDNGNVTAVVLQVTVFSARQSGTLTAFPDQAAVPGVPTFPFVAGRPVTSLVVVPIVNGNVDFYNGSSGPIQVAAALLGFYAG
jgi:hypothetical protein